MVGRLESWIAALTFAICLTEIVDLRIDDRRGWAVAAITTGLILLIELVHVLRSSRSRARRV